MAKINALVCLLILVIDIVAGVFGILAEIAENKVHKTVWIPECRHLGHRALELGFGAAALLVFSHAIAHLLGGCVCFGSKQDSQSSRRQLAVIFEFLSWLSFGFGLSLLLAGTLANLRLRRQCIFADHHFLPAGVIFCFIHGLVAAAYYALASAKVQEHGIP
ncbi:hypothetical protein FNV43_RR07724 [Rhamnella rubrinervis]|uniref:Uncharacterized protein n=1 Tax=Rhamnella rubrinervis TaxID=2594499 RepID=A0A8K0HG98_9ROSA|nr:hypothetical protein FNV43_RR07724 [Rhamnella rubrinervis]